MACKNGMKKRRPSGRRPTKLNRSNGVKNRPAERPDGFHTF
jgi:hypothetical protein